MRTRRLNDGTTAILALVFGAGAFAFMLGPVYLQRNLFLPADAFVAAVPLYGLLLSLAPVVLAFAYLIFSIAFLAEKGERQGRRYRAAELLQLLRVGRRGKVTAAVLTICFGAIGYGISAYWYATADGVTLNPGWISHSVTYDWSDVMKRVVSCHRSRGGPAAMLRLQMHDGQTLDVEGQQGSAFAKHFSQIAASTENADSEVGEVGNCPCFIRGFVRQLLLKQSAALPERSGSRGGDSSGCQ